MKKIVNTIAAIVASSAVAFADTNPCFTYLTRTFYPSGKDSGVPIKYTYRITGDGVEIKLWEDSAAYFDLTYRLTTVYGGATNSTLSFSPMTSSLAGSFSYVLTAFVNPNAADQQQPTVSRSLTVPWGNLCNVRGNSGQIEMWICEPGKTNVLSYGIIRIDSN